MTGATGFLGQALVRRLRAAGRPVHALARVGSDRSPLDCGPVGDRDPAGDRDAVGEGESVGLAPLTWHTGDLCEPPALERALGRAAADGPLDVVHSAALISYASADGERSRRVNVEGTRFLLHAAKQAAVRRFLFVSSVVAIGHAADGASVLDETAPFNGASLRVPYVTTKRAAEDFVLAVARELDVVVVNPGAVFGPSTAPTNTVRFLSRLARNRLGPLAPPGTLGVVGRECVVDGLLAALERGRRGERYLLVESNWSHLELFGLAARMLGARAPRRRFASSAWKAVCAGATALDRARPLRLATPQTLRLLGAHFCFDAARARTELGWAPRPFPEVLDEAVRAARERGFL